MMSDFSIMSEADVEMVFIIIVTQLSRSQHWLFLLASGNKCGEMTRRLIMCSASRQQWFARVARKKIKSRTASAAASAIQLVPMRDLAASNWQGRLTQIGADFAKSSDVSERFFKK